MSHRYALLVTALALFATSTYLTATGAGELAVDLQENVEYGTGADQKLTMHIARPKDATEPLPAILFIHGGGWQAGSKDMFKKAIRDFASEGYVAASVGYRFAPKYRTPCQIEDCKCAVRYLRAHADELKIDPTRIGAIGASAGAHLSLLLGTMDSGDGCEGEGGWQDQSSKVQCVVSYFGPVDLTETEIGDNPARQIINEQMVRGILTNFVGGKPEEHKDELRQASPITYVGPGDAPMLLFHGTKDVLVPYDHAFLMSDAMTKHGIKGRAELIMGAGHGWMGDEMVRTQKSALEFFDEHLKTEEK